MFIIENTVFIALSDKFYTIEFSDIEKLSRDENSISQYFTECDYDRFCDSIPKCNVDSFMIDFSDGFNVSEPHPIINLLMKERLSISSYTALKIGKYLLLKDVESFIIIDMKEMIIKYRCNNYGLTETIT